MEVTGLPHFERYIGIDYSGAVTPESSCRGLHVFIAEVSGMQEPVLQPPSPRGIAPHLGTCSSSSIRLYSLDGLRIPNRRAQGFRRHLQAVPPRHSIRRQGVPVPVDHGQVSPLRRIAPVLALRGLPRSA